MTCPLFINIPHTSFMIRLISCIGRHGSLPITAFHISSLRLKYHSTSNVRPETFGDYMSNNADVKSRTFSASESQLKPMPMGYLYFTKKFPRELKEFKRYLKKKYPKAKKADFEKPINYKMFSTVEEYHSKTYKGKKRLKLEPGLFVTLMKRNPDYFKYIVWHTFKIDLWKDDDQDIFYTVKNESVKSRSKSGQQIRAPNLLKKGKKTGNAESFKNFLHSINKIKNTSSTFDDVLPRMTDLKAIPTNPPTARFCELEEDLKKHDLESFLNHAKEDKDTRETGLFKSKMNYEWSKDRLANSPNSLDMQTFFNPLTIPGTLIPISWVRTADMSEIGKPRSRYLVLSKDGDEIILDNLTFLKQKPFKNLYNLFSTFEGRASCTSQIKDILSHGWRIVNGDENRLIFIKQSTDKILKIATVLGAFGTLIVAITIYRNPEENTKKRSS